MTLHEEVDELIAGYSLGAVDDAEAALVRRHLPDCPECQRTLLRMTEVVAVLPLSLEEVDPPKALRDRILARVAGADAARPVVAPVEAVEREPMGKLLFLRRVPSWAPVAVAAVLLVAMFGWNLSLQNRHSNPTPPAQQASLVDTSHSAVGTVTYMKDRQLAFVSFKALTAPASGKTYELWVIPLGGKPQAAGVFLPDTDGSKVLVLNRLINHGDIVAVTEEAPGGVAQPTGAPVITAQL